MNTLFEIGPVLPQGFDYYPDFITEAEETELVKSIGRFDLQTMKFHEYEAKRRVEVKNLSWYFPNPTAPMD